MSWAARVGSAAATSKKAARLFTTSASASVVPTSPAVSPAITCTVTGSPPAPA